MIRPGFPASSLLSLSLSLARVSRMRGSVRWSIYPTILTGFNSREPVG